jgi:hypothetical protein
VLGPVENQSIFGALAKAWKGLLGVCTEPPKIPSFDLSASTVEGPEGEKIDVPKWGPAVLFRGTAGRRPSKATGVLVGPKDVLHVSHPLLPSGGFVVPAGKNLRPAL